MMNHRKLISETEIFNLTSFCQPFCDTALNPSALCPDLCPITCPSSCFNTLPSPSVVVPTAHHHDSTRTLHVSLVVALCLVGLSCFVYCLFTTLYKVYNNRRRALEGQHQGRDRDEFVDEEHGPILDHPIWYIRTIGLQSSTIDLITTVKYKRGEGLVEGTDCSVCLSEFEDDETLRLLPKCNHAFHLPCIDTWLRSHTNCPMCRAPIVSNPNGALSPILEQSFERDSVVQEDSRVAVPEGSEARDRGNGDLEAKGVDTSQDGRECNKNEEIDEFQPMRRSVSMDSLASLRLSGVMANAKLGELGERNPSITIERMDIINQGLKRFTGSSSFKKSSQKRPASMNRSFSTSLRVQDTNSSEFDFVVRYQRTHRSMDSQQA